MDDIKVETNNSAAADSACQLLNVVPNPYYAYSEYENNIKSLFTIATPIDLKGLFRDNVANKNPSELPDQGYTSVQGIELRNTFFKEINVDLIVEPYELMVRKIFSLVSEPLVNIFLEKITDQEDTYTDQIGWTAMEESFEDYEDPTPTEPEIVTHQCSMCGSTMKIPRPKRERYKVICAYPECGHSDMVGI